MNDILKTRPGYQSRRGNSQSALKIAQKFEQPSPTGAGVIKYKLVHISSSKIGEVTKKSSFNKRSRSNLNHLAVADILPSIKESKYNDNPIKAYGTIDDMTIMEGLRRTYAVSTVEDGMLAVWLTDKISIEDEKIIVARSDQYQEPTTVDLAITIGELLEEQPEMSTDRRELARLYEVSKSTMQNAMDLQVLPKEYFAAFPTINDVPLVLSLSLVSTLSDTSPKDVKALFNKYLKPVNIDESEQERKKQLNALKDSIKDMLANLVVAEPAASTKAQTNNPLFGLKCNNAIKVHVDKKGATTIKLGKDVDAALLKKIAALIK